MAILLPQGYTNYNHYRGIIVIIIIIICNHRFVIVIISNYKGIIVIIIIIIYHAVNTVLILIIISPMPTKRKWIPFLQEIDVSATPEGKALTEFSEQRVRQREGIKEGERMMESSYVV